MTQPATIPGLGLPWPESWDAAVAHYGNSTSAGNAIGITHRTATGYTRREATPKTWKTRTKFLEYGYTDFELPPAPIMGHQQPNMPIGWGTDGDMEMISALVQIRESNIIAKPQGDRPSIEYQMSRVSGEAPIHKACAAKVMDLGTPDDRLACGMATKIIDRVGYDAAKRWAKKKR